MSGNKESGMRIAIVTGARRGIGFATALKLLNLGYRVVFIDTILPDLNDLPQALKANADAVQLDITDQSASQALITRLLDQYGQIDILVNNAGISLKNNQGRSNGMLEASMEEVQKMLDVNVLAMFRWCQYVLPGMKAQRWGRIVNVSSLAGRTVAHVAGPAYMLTKSAVLGLSRGIATEMGEFGITTNCIAPGRIQTDMAKLASDESNRAYAERIPVKRLGKPQEVAAAIAYLCSEEAGFTNGAVIDVNGGSFMS